MPKKFKREEKSEGILPLGVHIEIDRVASGFSVLGCDVRAVCDYSEECVLLRMKGGRIKIVGSALRIAVYENRIAEILGRVGGIELL